MSGEGQTSRRRAAWAPPLDSRLGHQDSIRNGTLDPGSAGGGGRRIWGWILIGFLWGTLNNFSAIAEGSATLVQGGALVMALVGAMIIAGPAPVILAWIRPGLGMLMAGHAIAALASALLARSGLLDVARYVLLLPAFGIFITAARSPGRPLRALCSGFLLAGAAFVAVHAVMLSPQELLLPTYRISLFLNPNGVAFISAMTGVAVLSFRGEHGTKGAYLAAALYLTSALVCFATKSRTGLAALIVGSGVAVLQGMRRNRRVMTASVIGVALAFIAVAKTGLLGELGRSFSDLYMLDDEYRSVGTGTYRFEAWEYLLREVWWPVPVLGVGPGRSLELVEGATGVAGAHNGILVNLAEVGVLGTLPLVLALAAALRRLREPALRWVVPIFMTGLVESVAETMFFSIGNSGSLLFCASVAALATWPARSAILTGTSRAVGTAGAQSQPNSEAQ